METALQPTEPTKPPEAAVKRPRPAPATIGAAALMILLTAGAVALGISFWLDAERMTVEEPFTTVEGTSFFNRLMAILVFVISAFVVSCSIGVLRVRPWARDGAVYSFTVFTAFSVLSFVAVPAGDEDPVFWIIVPSLLLLQVAVLLLLHNKDTVEQFAQIEARQMESRRDHRKAVYARDLMKRQARQDGRRRPQAVIITFPRRRKSED